MRSRCAATWPVISSLRHSSAVIERWGAVAFVHQFRRVPLSESASKPVKADCFRSSPEK